MDVSTSVKMTEADKRRLDALQADVTKRRRAKISQESLLHELVRLGEQNLDKLAPEEWKMSAAAKRKLLAVPMSTGKMTREETIDEDLDNWERGRP